ncbi:MAG: hypothetical protein OJF49_001529 [Ktedonobacterales bacterium]|nr:MAG: hypothetical protein OJF49_001529 [Ktedonobacterales bacterium]
MGRTFLSAFTCTAGVLARTLPTCVGASGGRPLTRIPQRTAERASIRRASRAQPL